MNFVKKLGKGSFGIVDLYEMKGELVAVKKFVTGRTQYGSVNSFDQDKKEASFKKELKILEVLKKGCVPFFPCLVLGEKIGDDFQIITNYIPDTYELRDFLSKNALPSIYVIYVIIENIANGLRIMHDKFNVVHNDIKPANMLINSKNLMTTYIDFGMGCVDNYKDCLRAVGTPNYCPPEKAKVYLKGRKENVSIEKSKSGDVWAVGMMIFNIMTKKTIYDYILNRKGIPITDFLKIVNDLKQPNVDSVIERVSKKGPNQKLICEIIWPALQVDWRKRITASEFYNRIVKEIPKILATNLPAGQTLHDINSRAAKDLVNFVVNPKTKYMTTNKANKTY